MIVNGEAHQLIRPLHLWPILGEAFVFLWDYRLHVGRLLTIPVTLMALFGVVTFYWPEGQGKSAVALIEALANLVIFTFFAISCHRLILIGEHAVSRRGVQRWRMRET